MGVGRLRKRVPVGVLMTTMPPGAVTERVGVLPSPRSGELCQQRPRAFPVPRTLCQIHIEDSNGIVSVGLRVRWWHFPVAIDLALALHQDHIPYIYF